MITQTIKTNNNTDKKKVKAVGMISGGLDSTLAAKIIHDIGIDVYGVYFAMPWGCCDKAMAIEAARAIGIKFITLQLDERYLEIIKNPKYGYGTAMNPCVDCRIHMFSRAAQYMKHIGADFVFTGEVLGQRPMSQQRHSMKKIERDTGLLGRLLRPLSAQVLEPTDIEIDGLIDRKKLLNLVGRSRKPQYDLAKKLNIDSFNQPAGGCLLTDHNFARRMKDTLDHGYRNFRETIALQWGKHFRIDHHFKVTLGRDEKENEALERYAHQDDIVMELADDKGGGTVILKGDQPNRKVLSTAAGLIKKYSKYKNTTDILVNFWKAKDRNKIEQILADDLSEQDIDLMKI